LSQNETLIGCFLGLISFILIKSSKLDKNRAITNIDHDEFIKNLSYDSVIFGFNGTELKILVLEYHNTGLFALPGGFIRQDEPIDKAVARGVRERTGLSKIYLEQFHTFGSMNRFDPDAMQRILEKNHIDVKRNAWMLGRFISIAYYALINYDKVILRKDALSDSINWYPIDELPPLMMDHEEMVSKALEVLRNNLEKKLVGMNLLPTKFTMKQLQKVYEAILGKELRRTTFQRRILALDILERQEKLYRGTAHKAPYLYSFR
jgi:ADP-ribose pyrophosphatase YjhB (NUDIX family)